MPNNKRKSLAEQPYRAPYKPRASTWLLVICEYCRNEYRVEPT